MKTEKVRCCELKQEVISLYCIGGKYGGGVWITNMYGLSYTCSSSYLMMPAAITAVFKRGLQCTLQATCM